MTTATDSSTGWRPADTLENRLRLVRAEKKLSQRSAAEAVGITQREWQSMEEGRAARRVDVKVRRIAMALGVDRDWLMWGGQLNEEGPLDPISGGSEEASSKGNWSTVAGLRVAFPPLRAAS